MPFLKIYLLFKASLFLEGVLSYFVLPILLFYKRKLKQICYYTSFLLFLIVFSVRTCLHFLLMLMIGYSV